jgi:hypothetical protein
MSDSKNQADVELTTARSHPKPTKGSADAHNDGMVDNHVVYWSSFPAFLYLFLMLCVS